MGMGVVAGIVLMLSSIAQSAHQVREPDLLLFEEALVVLTVVFLADKLFKLIEAVFIQIREEPIGSMNPSSSKVTSSMTICP